MTFLCTLALPHVGLIACDTRAYRSNGDEAGSTSKVFTIAHLNALLAVRGSHAVLAHVLRESWHLNSIDCAPAVMPALLQAFARSHPAAAARDTAGVQIGSDVHLIGFSPSRGRMVHLSWKLREGFAKITGADNSDDITTSHAPRELGELPSDEPEFAAFAPSRLLRCQGQRRTGRRKSASCQGRRLGAVRALLGGGCILRCGARQRTKIRNACRI